MEAYLHFRKYPNTYSKGDKANLRRKCHNNFKFGNGVLYYRRAKESRLKEENWRAHGRTASCIYCGLQNYSEILVNSKCK